MSANPGNKRKGRPTPGRRTRAVDRSLLVGNKLTQLNEGVYSNARLTHMATSLIGCNVTVQCKNGAAYEGIFKTFSPKFEVVLVKAHKVEADAAPGNIPSKDMVIEAVIFNLHDIVTIYAVDVDLDYAAKGTSSENFTDSAISGKYNGQVGEKELQPWEAEGPSDALEALENPAANGWDADDMFNINAEKFNVKSDYDPSLSQYTTCIEKGESLEYKQMEAHAEKMASEIEKSDTYKKNLDLENGDGDEEMLYSAVHRDNNQNSTGKYIPPHQRKAQGMGRAMRSNGPPSSSLSSNNPAVRVPPPNQNTPPSQQPLLSGGAPPSSSSVSAVSSQAGPHHATVSAGGGASRMSSLSPSEEATPDPRPSGREDRKFEPVEQRGSGRVTDMPTSVVSVGDMREPTSPLATKFGDPTKKMGGPNNPKPREEQIRELKEFGTQFKLSEESKERRPQQSAPATAPVTATVVVPASPSAVSQANVAVVSPTQASKLPLTAGANPSPAPSGTTPATPTSPAPTQATTNAAPAVVPVVVPSTVAAGVQPPVTAAQPQIPPQQQHIQPQVTTTAIPVAAAGHVEKAEDRSRSRGDSGERKDEPMAEKVKKSVLNPNAEEFKPNAKPFQPRQMQLPTTTPPRPATQSPAMPLPLPAAAMQGQPTSYLAHPAQAAATPYMVPVSMHQQPAAPAGMVPNQPQPARYLTSKKATVSVQPQTGAVRNDQLNQAAQAATGTPILAQQYPGGMPQYVPPHMMAPSGGALQQVYSQMMPTTRMITPPMMQTAQSLQEQGPMPQQQQQQLQPTGAVFVSTQPSVSMHGHLAHHPVVSVAHNSSHMAPHHQATPPHSTQATSHIPPQPQGQAGPQQGGSGAAIQPAPSPHQNQPPQQQQQQAAAGAQNSGTPQPHQIIYNAAAPLSQQHPPLQPSPHTPTSPHFPPPVTYAVYSQGGGHMQGSIQPLAYAQSHTTVTHAQHHHNHTHVPQHIMMHPAQPPQQVPTAQPPNPQPGVGGPPHGAPQAGGGNHGAGGPPAGMQQQATHVPISQYQQPAPHLPPHHPMQGPPQVHGQAGPAMVPQTINVSNQAGQVHPQVYAMQHPIPSQAPPPGTIQASAYPHNQ